LNTPVIGITANGVQIAGRFFNTQIRVLWQRLDVRKRLPIYVA
jgi:hypothetical protein